MPQRNLHRCFFVSAERREGAGETDGSCWSRGVKKTWEEEERGVGWIRDLHEPGREPFGGLGAP